MEFSYLPGTKPYYIPVLYNSQPLALIPFQSWNRVFGRRVGLLVCTVSLVLKVLFCSLTGGELVGNHCMMGNLFRYFVKGHGGALYLLDEAFLALIILGGDKKQCWYDSPFCYGTRKAQPPRKDIGNTS